MKTADEKGRLLSSWKEIADYLKCDVRTCRRWELIRGLPIHRLDGGPKSRIFAYQRELDDWVKGNGRLSASEEKNKQEKEASNNRVLVPSEARTRRTPFISTDSVGAAHTAQDVQDHRPQQGAGERR